MTVQMTKSPTQNAANPFKHAAGLSAVWQRCMSEVYGSECRMLFPQENGQLKRLKESLGMKRATEVAEYAIRNWHKFSRQSAKDVGSDIFPEKPSVGWLCKYHATAVMMLHEELQSKKQAQEAQAKKEAYLKEAENLVMQVAAHNAEITKAKPKKLTPEEWVALEAEVDAEFEKQESLTQE